MSVSKCVSASGYGMSCQAGNLEAEISRLTRELDEAKKENERLRTALQTICEQGRNLTAEAALGL